MSQYPRPEVPYEGYSDLHFATERQVRSPLVLGGYDRGELSAAPGRLTFRGMTAEVECDGVTSVRLVRKAFPWGGVLAVAAVAALLVAFEAPVPFSWRRPPVYIVALILLVVCVRQWRERWVEVTYADAGGERRAYFRREPIAWGSGAARTRRLCRDLQAAVLPGGAIRAAGAGDGPEAGAPEAGRTPGDSAGPQA